LFVEHTTLPAVFYNNEYLLGFLKQPCHNLLWLACFGIFRIWTQNMLRPREETKDEDEHENKREKTNHNARNGMMLLFMY
jgi:hypothetical protein